MVKARTTYISQTWPFPFYHIRRQQEVMYFRTLPVARPPGCPGLALAMLCDP